MESTNFDVFHLNQISGGHPLYFLALACLKRHKLFETFALDHARIQRFLLKIETGYLSSNPYHNATHAADVTQALNFYLTRDCLNKYLPPDELLGAILAAVIHDYQHPGVNNAFLVNQMDSLALQYNDNAVLEHFHCASAFQLMKDEKYDVLGTLPVDVRKSVREFMVSLVLATDMAVHFEQVGKFKNKMTAGGFDLEKRPDRKSVLSIAIKCADINNPSKPLHLCTKWTELIMEEFFKQGDEEKKRNMEVSMFMNRDNTDVPKCQIGFIDFIVSPLFEAWSLFMKDEVKPLLDNIASNKAYCMLFHGALY
ncbi:hypothetical protein BKA69DRAFT_1025594 [Paraphysoderma sedebokerense]|nr:hypothetical protein BKA69DRAFT_1025594 [Paraphysoderma sedebokerense]